MVEVERLRGRSRSFSPETNARHRRARSRSGGDLGLFFAGSVLCLVLFALLLTARQAEVARIGYEIGTLRKELAIQKAEYQRLDVEVARLQSFERVEAGAKRLGMKKPSEIRVVYSEEPEAPRQAITATAAPSLRQMLASFGTALARLASGVMGVEARTLK